MTTDGNYNVKYINTINIPQIIKGIAPYVMGGSYVALGMGRVQFYYNSSNFYTISEPSNYLYKAPISDIINGNLIQSAQAGGQNNFFASVYPTEINGYFYNFSTRNDSGVGQGGNIWRAPVGNPAAWYNTSVATPSNASQPMIYNDGTNIYILGGFLASTATNKIDTTTVSDPLTLSVSANVLPAARAGGAIVKIGSTLYMYGGYSSGGAEVDTIFSASISDPTTWTNLGSLLPVPLQSSAAYNDGTYIWLFGGFTTGNTAVNTIYRAAVATPTSFSSVGTLPAAAANLGIFVYNSNMHLVGYSSDSILYRAALSDLTSWTILRTYSTCLKSATRSAHSIIIGSYIYVYGGIKTGTTNETSIQYAPITSPLEWNTSASSLPAGLACGQLIKTKNYIYLLGANTTTGNVYRAAITTPTTWSLYGSAASGPAYSYGNSLISNGYVFYFGGESAVGTPVTTVSRAVINSSSTTSGDIVGWINTSSAYLTMALPIALSRFSLIVAGDYVYILGGYTTGPVVNTDIYRINLNKVNTGWVNVGTLSQAIISGTTVLVNNTIYIVGGDTTTAFTSTDDYVTYASLSDLSNGNCSFIQENTGTQATATSITFAEATSFVINDEIYFVGMRTATDGSRNIYKTIYKYPHTLISPRVPEATNSLPTVDLKSGALGSYTSYQRTGGLLPWLVSDL
tara:strand:- start:13325 stop:15376 length:2052 start_codon:yes stop_codon:yes gene_type:complete